MYQTIPLNQSAHLQAVWKEQEHSGGKVEVGSLLCCRNGEKQKARKQKQAMERALKPRIACRSFNVHQHFFIKKKQKQKNICFY